MASANLYTEKDIYFAGSLLKTKKNSTKTRYCALLNLSKEIYLKLLIKSSKQYQKECIENLSESVLCWAYWKKEFSMYNTSPIRLINLIHCELVTEGIGKKEFAIQYTHKDTKRIFNLSAPDEKKRNDWIGILSQAILIMHENREEIYNMDNMDERIYDVPYEEVPDARDNSNVYDDVLTKSPEQQIKPAERKRMPSESSCTNWANLEELCRQHRCESGYSTTSSTLGGSFSSSRGGSISSLGNYGNKSNVAEGHACRQPHNVAFYDNRDECLNNKNVGLPAINEDDNGGRLTKNEINGVEIFHPTDIEFIYKNQTVQFTEDKRNQQGHRFSFKGIKDDKHEVVVGNIAFRYTSNATFEFDENNGKGKIVIPGKSPLLFKICFKTKLIFL